MTVQEATAVARDCLRGGYQVELREPAQLPYWRIEAPDGQVRTLMGLHRLTEAQIRNRVKGLVLRMHKRV